MHAWPGFPTEYKFVAQRSGTMVVVWLLDRRRNRPRSPMFITVEIIMEPEHFEIEQKVARTAHRAVLLPVSPASRTAMRPVTGLEIEELTFTWKTQAGCPARPDPPTDLRERKMTLMGW